VHGFTIHMFLMPSVIRPHRSTTYVDLAYC